MATHETILSDKFDLELAGSFSLSVLFFSPLLRGWILSFTCVSQARSLSIYLSNRAPPRPKKTLFSLGTVYLAHMIFRLTSLCVRACVLLSLSSFLLSLSPFAFCFLLIFFLLSGFIYGRNQSGKITSTSVHAWLAGLLAR